MPKENLNKKTTQKSKFSTFKSNIEYALDWVGEGVFDIIKTVTDSVTHSYYNSEVLNSHIYERKLKSESKAKGFLCRKKERPKLESIATKNNENIEEMSRFLIASIDDPSKNYIELKKTQEGNYIPKITKQGEEAIAEFGILTQSQTREMINEIKFYIDNLENQVLAEKSNIHYQRENLQKIKKEADEKIEEIKNNRNQLESIVTENKNETQNQFNFKKQRSKRKIGVVTTALATLMLYLGTASITTNLTNNPENSYNNVTNKNSPSKNSKIEVYDKESKQYRRIKSQNIELEESINSIQAKLDRKENIEEKYNESLLRIRQLKSAYLKEESKLKKEIEELTLELNEKETENNEYKRKYTVLKKINSKKETENDELAKENSYYTQKLESLAKEKELLNKRHNKKYNDKETNIKELEKMINNLNNKITEYKENNIHLKDEYQLLKTRFNKIKKEINSDKDSFYKKGVVDGKIDGIIQSEINYLHKEFINKIANLKENNEYVFNIKEAWEKYANFPIKDILDYNIRHNNNELILYDDFYQDIKNRFNIDADTSFYSILERENINFSKKEFEKHIKSCRSFTIGK